MTSAGMEIATFRLVAQYLKYLVKWLMNNELERIWKQAVVTRSSRSLELVWWDWENPRRSSVRVFGVLAESQTEHLPNTSLECYRYTSLLDLYAHSAYSVLFV
jgi:hypothetical protein